MQFSRPLSPGLLCPPSMFKVQALVQCAGVLGGNVFFPGCASSCNILMMHRQGSLAVQSSPAQQIPLHFQRVAFVYRLGKAQVIYASQNNLLLSRLFGFLALLIGCLIIVLYLFTSALFLSWWPLWQASLIPLIGFAWLGMGAWLALTSARTRKLSLVVCSEGLICIRREMHIIRWDQIMAWWKDITTDSKGRVSHSYTLQLTDGTTWTFNSDLVNVEELGAIIEDEVTNHLLPYLLSAYRSGIPIHFGAITLSMHGISMQGGRQRVLPWSYVQRLHLDDASLSVYKVGGLWDWATIPISEIPNVGVLKRLADEVVKD